MVRRLPAHIYGEAFCDAQLPILAILMQAPFPLLQPLSKILFLLRILSRGIINGLSQSKQELIQEQISV
jgi:hypothetical protein